MYEHLDRRYALALYNTCTKANNLEIVLEQFEEIIKEFSNNGQVKILLKNPLIAKVAKKRIFKEIFQNSIETELLNFLLLLIERDRILYLKEKFNQLREIYFEHNNTVIAKVTSAIPLTDSEKEKLKNNLEKRYEKTIVIEEVIDTSIIGVMKILVGDEAVDGSIEGKLKEVSAICRDIDSAGYEEFKRKYLNRENNSILREKEIELVAEVTTSIPLTDSQREKLILSLKKFYSRNIAIKETVDHRVLGGVLVKVGDDIIDGTIKDKPQYIKRDIFIGSIEGKLKEASAICCDIDSAGYEEFKREYLNREDNSILRKKEIELVAEVTTAIPLTDSQREKLILSLKKFYSRNIVIKETVDHRVLGGVLVKIGDDIIDGTIKDKPQYIKRDMLFNNLVETRCRHAY